MLEKILVQNGWVGQGIFMIASNSRIMICSLGLATFTIPKWYKALIMGVPHRIVPLLPPVTQWGQIKKRKIGLGKTKVVRNFCFF